MRLSHSAFFLTLLFIVAPLKSEEGGEKGGYNPRDHFTSIFIDKKVSIAGQKDSDLCGIIATIFKLEALLKNPGGLRVVEGAFTHLGGCSLVIVASDSIPDSVDAMVSFRGITGLIVVGQRVPLDATFIDKLKKMTDAQTGHDYCVLINRDRIK